MEVRIELVAPGAILPSRSYKDDAGWDLYTIEGCLITPHSFGVVDTGIKIAIPTGWCAHLIGRSSSIRKGIVVVEAIIDAGYRGSISFTVQNTTNSILHVQPRDRLAQLIFLPVPQVEWLVMSYLDDSHRQGRGYGSSGR